MRLSGWQRPTLNHWAPFRRHRRATDAHHHQQYSTNIPDPTLDGLLLGVTLLIASLRRRGSQLSLHHRATTRVIGKGCSNCSIFAQPLKPVEQEIADRTAGGARLAISENATQRCGLLNDEPRAKFCSDSLILVHDHLAAWTRPVARSRISFECCRRIDGGNQCHSCVRFKLI